VHLMLSLQSLIILIEVFKSFDLHTVILRLVKSLGTQYQ